MSAFTFDTIQEAQSTFKPTLDPGIHEVIILGHEFKQPDDLSKSAYEIVKFTNIEGTREASIKFYLNDSLKEGKTKTAMDIWLGNAKHIAKNCRLSEAEIARIKGNNKYELLVAMLNACIGKPYRQKFVGEEYLDKDGKVQVKVNIGFPNFAESLDIPAAESKLLFKSTDSYDYKRLPISSSESAYPSFIAPGTDKQETLKPEGPTDKLPF